MSSALAVRTLKSGGGLASVRLELYQPQRADSDDASRNLVEGTWFCRYCVVRADEVLIDDIARGWDAFQAIVNSISELRARFNSLGIDAYCDLEDEDDDSKIEGTGFPAYVPQEFGADLERRLEQMVKNEVEAWAKATE